MSSLAGFCYYDRDPWTKKYKVVASSTKRKGWVKEDLSRYLAYSLQAWLGQFGGCKEEIVTMPGFTSP